jgi:hypothetical protein
MRFHPDSSGWQSRPPAARRGIPASATILDLILLYLIFAAEACDRAVLPHAGNRIGAIEFHIQWLGCVS